VLHVHASSRASFWRKCFFIVPARWLRKSVIFHLHGSEFMQFYRQECGSLKKTLVRRVLDSCTKILVLSESWRRDLSGITRNPDIDVLFNSVVRNEKRHSSQTKQQCTLLFLGRLGRRKGIYVLLTALAAAKKQYPEVMLLCGGDGELDEVRAAANRLDIRDNVQILGWVQGPEKDSLLESASIFVLPSFAEGLPMSVLEAMATGLPVISTPVGGIPEVITHGTEGLLIPPGDAVALGEAICLLLGDADLRAQMGRNGYARFEQDFSIESVLAKLTGIYRSLGVFPRAEEVTTSS
jgi:glycosyltransferase involved in cell wall biosynthesis